MELRTVINIIVCTDQNGLFSYNGKSITPPKGDLKRFRQITHGHVVIMGRFTWESLPVKPLSDRINIVITKSKDQSNDYKEIYDCESLIESLVLSQETWPDKHIFIIGGQQLYNEALPLADRIARTVVHNKVPDDLILTQPRYFHIPGEGWKLTSIKHYDDYDFEVYERC